MLNPHLDLKKVHIPSTTIRRTSQVYQRWRDLLLSYPLIWAASLDLGDPKAWSEVVLTRASSVPLAVALQSLSRAIASEREDRRSEISDLKFEFQQYSGFSPFNEQLDLALSLLPRCRRFSITVYSRKEQSRLVADKVDVSTAPHLEELSLSGNPKKPGLRISSDTPEGSPNRPQLKTLKLEGYWIDFSSPPLLHLTKLAMVLATHKWLKILCHLPQLEELLLEVDDQKPTSDDTPIGTLPRPIFLSRLQFLGLKAIRLRRSCLELLSQLRVPASCALDLGVHFFSTEAHPYPESARMISELCKKFQASLQYRRFLSLARNYMVLFAGDKHPSCPTR